MSRLGWSARRRERRALRLGDVELCRRLGFEGWENLHGISGTPLFLIAPHGAWGLAGRIVGLYHEGCDCARVLAPAAGEETVDAELLGRPVRCTTRPARRALASGAAAVWILVVPRPKGRWTVRYTASVRPADDDTAASLTERYVSVLEEALRDRPG